MIKISKGSLNYMVKSTYNQRNTQTDEKPDQALQGIGPEKRLKKRARPAQRIQAPYLDCLTGKPQL